MCSLWSFAAVAAASKCSAISSYVIPLMSKFLWHSFAMCPRPLHLKHFIDGLCAWFLSTSITFGSHCGCPVFWHCLCCGGIWFLKNCHWYSCCDNNACSCPCWPSASLSPCWIVLILSNCVVLFSVSPNFWSISFSNSSLIKNNCCPLYINATM